MAIFLTASLLCLEPTYKKDIDSTMPPQHLLLAQGTSDFGWKQGFETTKIHLAFSYLACHGVWDRYKSEQDTNNFRQYPFRTTRIREYEEIDEHSIGKLEH